MRIQCIKRFGVEQAAQKKKTFEFYIIDFSGLGKMRAATFSVSR